MQRKKLRLKKPLDNYIKHWQVAEVLIVFYSSQARVVGLYTIIHTLDLKFLLPWEKNSIENDRITPRE